MIVYLAGAIDQVTGAEATGWRTSVAEALRKEGIAVFDPAAAFRCDLEGSVPTTGNEKFITEIDLEAVVMADALFVLETEKPTCGTYVEVGVAWSHHVPIIVWAYPNRVPMFLRGVADRISPYLDNVIADLVDVLAEE